MVLAGVCLLLASLFSLTAAIGLLRLPDVFTRMHAASKAGTLGSGFALLAIALMGVDFPIIMRAIFGILFFLLTAPIAAHLLARAAIISGNAKVNGHVEKDIAEQK